MCKKSEIKANGRQGSEIDTNTKSLPSKTPKGKQGAFKATHAPQLKHYKQTAKRTVSFPKIGQTVIKNENKITRTYMWRHTMTEIVNHSNSRSTALEQLINILLGDLNRFYVATSLALSSAVVDTRHLLSPREGFLGSLRAYFRKGVKGLNATKSAWFRNNLNPLFHYMFHLIYILGHTDLLVKSSEVNEWHLLSFRRQIRLVSGKGCGLWLRHSLDFSLTFLWYFAQWCII